MDRSQPKPAYQVSSFGEGVSRFVFTKVADPRAPSVELLAAEHEGLPRGSGEDISPAERAKLDKEVEAYALEMEAFWMANSLRLVPGTGTRSGLTSRSMPSRVRRSLKTLAARRPTGTSCGKASR